MEETYRVRVYEKLIRCPHAQVGTMDQRIHASYKNILEQFLDDPRTTGMRDAYYPQLHMAVLVKRGKVIASATNRFGTRSSGAGYCEASIHAERNVIKELGDISLLRGADMMIMRFSKNPALDGFERFRNSKPCCQCQPFLEKCMREYGLRNVYYTA